MRMFQIYYQDCGGASENIYLIYLTQNYFVNTLFTVQFLPSLNQIYVKVL